MMSHQLLNYVMSFVHNHIIGIADGGSKGMYIEGNSFPLLSFFIP